MRADDQALAEKVAAFAGTHIAGREDLFEQTRVPQTLWQALADAGLFGIALPRNYGGGGGDYRSLAAAARTMVSVGGCQGLAMSWMAQNLLPRFLILRNASDAQKTALLPTMAAGKTTLSVAISEPGVGAHPKHLTTRAAPTASGYAITGKKVWLTNGPMADLFLVLAITESTGGRNRFSLFAVPRDTPGLSIVETPPLDFLRPSPHCGLKLDGCMVSADAVIGAPGTAFERMALHLRDVEDAILASTLTGAFRHQVALVASHRAGGEAAEAIGEAAAMLAALDAVAAEAVALLDAEGPESGRLARLNAGLHLLAQQFQAHISPLVSGENAGDSVLQRVTRDIIKSLDIARAARRLRHRKLGEAMISQTNPSL